MPDAIRVAEGMSIDYTPEIDVDAGDVVVVERIVGIAEHDIDGETLGALAVEGIFDVPKTAEEEIDAGEWVYWDIADNGSATTTDTTLSMGYCVRYAASADAKVRVKLQYLPETEGEQT